MSEYTAGSGMYPTYPGDPYPYYPGTVAPVYVTYQSDPTYLERIAGALERIASTLEAINAREEAK